MKPTDTTLDDEQIRRLREDILDSIDEELEMSFEDGSDENANTLNQLGQVNRSLYFRELLRLQGELVKLQDWVDKHALAAS